MNDYYDPFKLAIEILAGQIIENIKSRDEKGCPSSEIKKEHEIAERHVAFDVGNSKELLFSMGKLGGSNEEFKRGLEEIAPPGTFHHDRAAFPSEQHKEFLDLLTQIDALQTCYRRLNWATRERLVEASQSEIWDELDSRLDLAVSNVKAAIEITPKRRGGPVPNEYKRKHVDWCLSTFNAFRPGEASSTEGGAFRTYVALIHELATGDCEGDYDGDTKRRLSFERSVKEGLRLERERKGPDFTP